MTTIEINGKELQVEAGSMVIEAADKAGIYIPRFCYHKKLSIAANCRMCLVEVEKAGKPLPACATPITDGMKVFTRSKKALEAQRAVMEFLLINHPLDCPICDQGGECELQDLAMGFGRDRSRFTEAKRSVHDDDLGPLIASDMTRCIQCTRCVRFGQEVSGVRELGAMSRGELVEITTYVKKILYSELSGNIIDLCPVGALTSKPFRFQARAFEMVQKPSIAPHDGVGSNLMVHVRRNIVLRVVPKEQEAINEVWISDRDRFSYAGLYTDRLARPMIKKEGNWEAVDWTEALSVAAQSLRKLVAAHGGDQLAALLSPSTTCEEGFLLHKLMQELGAPHVEHRLRLSDPQFKQALVPATIQLEDLENQDRILVIGSLLREEQPLIHHRVRKATLNEGQVFCINTVDGDFTFPLTGQIIDHPQHLVAHITGVLAALNHTQTMPKLPAHTPSAMESSIAQQFLTGKHKTIIVGALALHHPRGALIYNLIVLMAQITGAGLLVLPDGANSMGLDQLRHGAPSTCPSDVWETNRKGYLLFNLEPELDCAHPALVQKALAAADCVIAFSPYAHASLLESAHVIFPTVPFTENEGSYINVTGKAQNFSAAVTPYEEAKPGWRALCGLANQAFLSGFEFADLQGIQKQLPAISNTLEPVLSDFDLDPVPTGLTRITVWPIYRMDALTRRSIPLQAATHNLGVGVYVNKRQAEQLQVQHQQWVRVTQGQDSTQLRIYIREQVPDGCALIPAGYPETAVLGASFGSVEVSPVW